MTMPKKDINYQEVEDLAANRVKQGDIAVYLGWDPNNFSTRKKHDAKLREALRRGYSRFGVDLAKAQRDKAIVQKDTKLLIHLGECYLDQKQKLEISGDKNAPIAMTLVDIVQQATRAKEGARIIEDEELDDYETFEEGEE